MSYTMKSRGPPFGFPSVFIGSILFVSCEEEAESISPYEGRIKHRAIRNKVSFFMRVGVFLQSYHVICFFAIDENRKSDNLRFLNCLK